MKSKRRLASYPLSRPIMLSVMWASLMFLYIYNDYIIMFVPGRIDSMSAGDLGIGEATPTLLLVVGILMAIPSLMIFLSAALPPVLSKWLNVIFGLIYCGINALTFTSPHLFYKTLVVIEVALTLGIVAAALTWPKDVVDLKSGGE